MRPLEWGFGDAPRRDGNCRQGRGWEQLQGEGLLRGCPQGWLSRSGQDVNRAGTLGSQGFRGRVRLRGQSRRDGEAPSYGPCGVGQERPCAKASSSLGCPCRIHTGDRPYKCPHPGCEKAFTQLSNLQVSARWRHSSLSPPRESVPEWGDWPPCPPAGCARVGGLRVGRLPGARPPCPQEWKRAVGGTMGGEGPTTS